MSAKKKDLSQHANGKADPTGGNKPENHSQKSGKEVTIECIDGVVSLNRVKHSLLPLGKLPVSEVYYRIDHSENGLDLINFSY